jgi:radical SAM superfamily enzyme YgiQ (UPF0313 family)
MHVKFILPALVEATGEFWRPIKYSLFPPLGLATLAGYLRDDDSAEITDEHVERLRMDDRPDLVAIETYITSAKRCYGIADHYRSKGVYVVLGGLHVTSLPQEGLRHADTVVAGPAEEAWPRFLADFRAGRPERLYRSTRRDLNDVPLPRRELIRTRNYLVPNSLVVSRGCPHACDFCYKTSFFAGGRSFYTYTVDRALTEIAPLPGRHLFFLDDNILGEPEFGRTLFHELRGMRRIWQGASTVASVLDLELLDVAVASGLKSLFIGFESLDERALVRHRKGHNRYRDYRDAVRALHERGVMINASFVLGLDSDDPSVFDATVEWAIEMGLETATFHILTPYPGTPLFERLTREGRILHQDGDAYDTRHLVFRHPTMSPQTVEAGYWRAYERFYRLDNLARSAWNKSTLPAVLRHLAYTIAWKKIDPLWALLIRLRQLGCATPMLEAVLQGRRRRIDRAGLQGIRDLLRAKTPQDVDAS